jgi:hypothetical protein
MDQDELKLKVGDQVIISRPTSTRRFSAHVEQPATVTATRSKSFDAGGLCFRNDGREWNGHNRVRLFPADDAEKDATSQEAAAETGRLERASEDAMLAYLLSSRDETDWLKLGLPELRRIAVMHGIMPRPAGSFKAANAGAND